MSRWIKALTCSLVLAGLGLGGCVGADDDSDVDSTSEAVQLGEGTDLEAVQGESDGEDAEAGYVLELDDSVVEGNGFELPGTEAVDPVPEPWNQPRGPRQSGDPDTDADAEAKHVNLI